MLMPDSQLNGAERALQRSFRNSPVFNSLLMAAAVAAAYLPMRSLPDRRAIPPALVALEIRPVNLSSARSPLRLAGAWELETIDRRFSGLSALAIDRGRFFAVSDRGAAMRFDLPSIPNPVVWIADLRDGPGPWGEKWSRDAESIAPDPGGRGWWVGYEQYHSLRLYDDQFSRSLTSIDLQRDDWKDNRGAEGLLTDGSGLLVTAENGRDAMEVSEVGIKRLQLKAGADAADAARAPDGSGWLLLRTKGLDGLNEAIAPLIRTKTGYRSGRAWPVPKGLFDNYEGMAIEPRPDGGWRFWLITDDGHRVMARTLLVALDYVPSAANDKSPAGDAGLSKKPSGKKP
jgi:hypothetical protein